MLRGKIVRFLKRRDERGYAKFEFQTEPTQEEASQRVDLAGRIPDVTIGVRLKVETEENGAIKSAQPDFGDEEFIRQLLCSVKGISKKTAEKILQSLDYDIENIKTKWEDETFWGQLSGSSKYREPLLEKLKEMFALEEIVRDYSRFGIGYPQAERIITVFGDDGIQKLKDNPYSCFYRIGLSFESADVLARENGFSFMDPRRIKALINEVLQENERAGSTAITVKQFFTAIKRKERRSAWPNTFLSPYAVLAVLAGLEYVYMENGMYGYARMLRHEKNIAWHLHRLQTADTEFCPDATALDKIYNEKQAEFLRAFAKNSVTLLVGSGGTGKTFTISGAIKLMQAHKENAKIKLCAPTARAAGVLREATGMPASTIHVLLGLKPYGEELSGKDENDPLDADLIIVDEMSMVDTELFHALLRAVPRGAKIILSGDTNQLESVGPGTVLKDLIESEAVPTVRLTQIMRQEEKSLIVRNCQRILEGDADFETGPAFFIRQCGTEEEAAAYLKSIYRPDMNDTQVLSVTTKGRIGTVRINRLFEKTSGGAKFHGETFTAGDKVVFTRNNYRDGYCNGDEGEVKSVAPMKIRIREDKTHTKLLPVSDANMADVTHAFAITVHKAQGSEYDNVIFLLPADIKPLLNRNIVNTAISRAKKQITVITVGEALGIAAQNHFKSVRVTRLKESVSAYREGRAANGRNPSN